MHSLHILAVPSAAHAAAIAGRPEDDSLALRLLLVYLDRGYRDAQVRGGDPPTVIVLIEVEE